jgi:integrase/recombinase XerD
MKLGSLLLQGFLSKRKLNKSFERVPVRGAATRKRAQKLLVAMEPKHPVRVLQSARLDSPKTDSGLSTLDFIRPDGKLKKSIEAFLLDQRSEHTRKAYGKDLTRFLKYLLFRKIEHGPETLNRHILIGYKDFLLSEKLQHTTIDRHLACLKSFFRWIMEDGIIDRNFAEGVRFLNPKRESTTQGFTDQEVSQVLALPNLYQKSGSLHYAILMVLFYCGLRRSELCDLRTTSIGIERGHHYLKLKGKGNSERIVVMTKPVWESIEHYLRITRKKRGDDQPLFSPVKNNRTLVRDKAIDSSLVFYIVRKYSARAGIKHRVSPHSCRATAISNARDHHVADRAIQEFAGWATTTMITRYDKRKTALEKSAVHSISYGNFEREIPSPSLITAMAEGKLR